MFGINNKNLKDDIVRLTISEEDLKGKVKELERVNKSLTEEIQGYKQHICKSVSDCGFSVNFKLLNAFSIERAIKTNNREYNFDYEVTNIGYLIGGKINEWVFECSKETHERLVKEFNEYKALQVHV